MGNCNCEGQLRQCQRLNEYVNEIHSELYDSETLEAQKKDQFDLLGTKPRQTKHDYLGYNYEKDHNFFLDSNPELVPVDRYSRSIFQKINNLRQNPQAYIEKFEECKRYIERKKKKFIYNNKTRVYMQTGIPAIENTINFLKTLEPMEGLIYSPKLNIPLPDENQIKDKLHIKDGFTKLKEKGVPIISFWKDIIKDPEVAFLLMVIDDRGENEGLRRKIILDKNTKFIGVQSISHDDDFVCYLSFSD